MQEEKLPAWAKGNVVGRPGRDESMLSMRAPHCDDEHPCVLGVSIGRTEKSRVATGRY